jgi:hypothetical protein
MPLVFVSYSHRDQTFAKQLVADLHKANVSIWFDLESILGGQQWDVAIENGLDQATHVVFIVSPSALASDYVNHEINTALNKGHVILPVLLQECKLPPRLRRIQYIDFRGDYQQALTMLLRVVPTESGQTTGDGDRLSTAVLLPASTPAGIAAAVSKQVAEIAESYATAQAAITLLEAKASSTKEWRAVAYDETTDGTLADLAADSSDTMIARNAAMACAELRSVFAVNRLVAKARTGQPRALQALAWIREDVESLPPSVDPITRSHAYWLMTRQELMDRPLELAGRALGAAVGYALGIGVVIYVGYVGNAIFADVRGGLRNGTALGTTYGLLMGMAILAATTLSARLEGWRLPLRIGVALAVGTLLTAIAFMPLHLLYERLEPFLLVSSAVFISGFAVAPALTKNTLVRAMAGAVGIFAATFGTWQLMPEHALIDLSSQPLLLSVWVSLIVAALTFTPELLGYLNERNRRRVAARLA